MRKIRVLQIVTRLVGRGVPRQVLKIATGLDADRYEVDVLAGRSEAHEKSLWEEARHSGVSTHYVASLQRQVGPSAVAAFSAIYRHIRRGCYDIVHTHISTAGILGRLAARAAGVSVVLHTYHGRIAELHDGSLRSRVFLACERLVARQTDALVACSEDMVRHYLECGVGVERQYRVIYNAIDPDAFLREEGPGEKPAGLEGKLIVGTAASLTPEKGLDVLLRAMPELLRRCPDVYLLILGEGPLRSDLQRMIREMELEQSVGLPGHVEDVRSWLAAFQVFVLPSKSDGVPTAILEAMAMELPVVASRVGGVPEILRQGEIGVMVDPGDPRQLAQALASLLEDPSKCKHLGRIGRQRVRQTFGLDCMIGRLDELYMELLQAKNRQR